MPLVTLRRGYRAFHPCVVRGGGAWCPCACMHATLISSDVASTRVHAQQLALVLVLWFWFWFRPACVSACAVRWCRYSGAASWDGLDQSAWKPRRSKHFNTMYACSCWPTTSRFNLYFTAHPVTRRNPPVSVCRCTAFVGCLLSS